MALLCARDATTLLSVKKLIRENGIACEVVRLKPNIGLKSKRIGHRKYIKITEWPLSMSTKLQESSLLDFQGEALFKKDFFKRHTPPLHNQPHSLRKEGLR